ncbi:hypothetical protein EHM92_00105 [bacterium]|nr:MAG: hypothetical protein EHM92_00105 [bacterium]
MNHIIKQISDAISAKYPKGAAEHNSKLYEYSALALLDAAIEETIDLPTYLYTLRDALIAMIEQMQALKDENDYLRMQAATEVDR